MARRAAGGQDGPAPRETARSKALAGDLESFGYSVDCVRWVMDRDPIDLNAALDMCSQYTDFQVVGAPDPPPSQPQLPTLQPVQQGKGGAKGGEPEQQKAPGKPQDTATAGALAPAQDPGAGAGAGRHHHHHQQQQQQQKQQQQPRAMQQLQQQPNGPNGPNGGPGNPNGAPGGTNGGPGGMPSDFQQMQMRMQQQLGGVPPMMPPFGMGGGGMSPHAGMGPTGQFPQHANMQQASSQSPAHGGEGGPPFPFGGPFMQGPPPQMSLQQSRPPPPGW